MDTSDDVLGLGGGGGIKDIPSKKAENIRRTAIPIDRGSEAARQERQRRRAAAGQQLEPPKLGTPGLFGVI